MRDKENLYVKFQNPETELVLQPPPPVFFFLQAPMNIPKDSY